MLVPNIKINIDSADGRSWSIGRVISCTVFKSADNLLDEAHFSLPFNIKWDKSPDIPDFEQSYIEIFMGYGDSLYRVFAGFVMYIQVDSSITVWCSGLLAKYKYINNDFKDHAEYYGISFPEILSKIGVEEQIYSDMKDRPWYFPVKPGSVFGLLEYLKRRHIHSSLVSDGDNLFFVLSRRYLTVISRGASFKFGRDIISFKDARVKHNLPSDIQFNANASVIRQIHFTNADRKPDVVDAEIAVSWPELRGPKIDISFWGLDTADSLVNADIQQQIHDAAFRVAVARGRVKPANLITFGHRFVEPLEEISVSLPNEVSPSSFLCLSNNISFSRDGLSQSLNILNIDNEHS